MTTRKATRPANKALARTAVPSRRRKAPRSLLSALPVRTMIVVAGIAGLAALGVALLGTRRFQDEIVTPLRAATLVPLAAAVAPQADRAWAETRHWRDQVSRVLSSINTAEVREQIADRLSHWLERFR
ncbi:MAG TPA: hypothetical protein VNU97_01890 [Rhizomicrobium sp.]|jgi:hypothetical protein|nr:hypothetical protein [Rhizomicrobium sp.]